MIPVIVISLPRASDRRARIAAHFAELGIGVRFLPAVDGSSITTTAFSRTYQRNLIPGELGCYLSHIEAVKMIAESDDEFAAVLEDDVELTQDALSFLEPGTLRSLPRFEILRLVGQWHGKRKTFAKIGNISVCAPLYPGAAAHAQIYSKAGAATIAKYLPVTDPIDVAVFFNPPLRRFRVLDVEQPITRQIGTSGIDPSGQVRALSPSAVWGSRQGRVHRLKQHLNFMLSWGWHYFSTARPAARSTNP